MSHELKYDLVEKNEPVAKQCEEWRTHLFIDQQIILGLIYYYAVKLMTY